MAAGLLVLAGCGIGPVQIGQRSAQDIVIQQSDVSGLTRCADSGSPDSVAQAQRKAGDTSGADSLAKSWQDAQGNGGKDGYVVAYGPSASDCTKYLFGSQNVTQMPGNWLFNYVVVFGSDSQAQAAWKSGLYLGSPDQFKTSGGAVGKDTGLGDNSAVLSSSSLGWLAIWSKGSSYSVLFTNYGPLTAMKLAQDVYGRM